MNRVTHFQGDDCLGGHIELEQVLQPPGSNQCGQACIATIAGITISDAIIIVGKRGSTRTKDLCKALRVLGFECADRLKRGQPRQEHIAIAKVIPRKGHRGMFHWVLFVHGQIYDPLGPLAEKYLVSSFLEIRKRP